MSLNEEQQDYAETMGRMVPALRCWCGWYTLGQCPHCPAGKTCADKIAVRCPRCLNAPPPDGSRPNVHVKGCANETPDERAYYAATMKSAAAGRPPTGTTATATTSTNAEDSRR